MDLNIQYIKKTVTAHCERNYKLQANSQGSIEQTFWGLVLCLTHAL